MKSSELVFVGIKGSVVALNHATGQQAWTTRLLNSAEDGAFTPLANSGAALMMRAARNVACKNIRSSVTENQFPGVYDYQSILNPHADSQRPPHTSKCERLP